MPRIKSVEQMVASLERIEEFLSRELGRRVRFMLGLVMDDANFLSSVAFRGGDEHSEEDRALTDLIRVRIDSGMAGVNSDVAEALAIAEDESGTRH